MKKLFPLLLIISVGFVAIINAQEVDSVKRKLDSLETQFDPTFRHDIDSLRLKLERFKKYKLNKKSIGVNWIKQKIGFNDNCDSVMFNDTITYCDLLKFGNEFDAFLTQGHKDDTIVFIIDGRNLSYWNLAKSMEIVADHLDKYEDKGVYTFALIPFEFPVRKQYTNADTLEVRKNNTLFFKGKEIKHSNLKKFLKQLKPEVLIINCDKTLPLEKLVDILKVTNKLKINAMLGEK